jgi:hypothetical protein
VSTFPLSSVKNQVIKYANRGILLDTSVLLVCVVGRMDPNRIEKFKNTNTFTLKDYRFLEEFLRLFSTVAVTPHIITEVSNLAGQLTEPAKGLCFDSFARDIQVLHEGVETAANICGTPLFRRLGITDAGIAMIAKGRFLVLTTDLNLHVALLNSGVDATNYNHIRPIG